MRARGSRPLSGLVQEQHLRIVEQHAGQAQPLRLPRRERVGVGVAFEVEIDQVEHLVAHACGARRP